MEVHVDWGAWTYTNRREAHDHRKIAPNLRPPLIGPARGPFHVKPVRDRNWRAPALGNETTTSRRNTLHRRVTGLAFTYALMLGLDGRSSLRRGIVHDEASLASQGQTLPHVGLQPSTTLIEWSAVLVN